MTDAVCDEPGSCGGLLPRPSAGPLCYSPEPPRCQARRPGVGPNSGSRGLARRLLYGKSGHYQPGTAVDAAGEVDNTTFSCSSTYSPSPSGRGRGEG